MRQVYREMLERTPRYGLGDAVLVLVEVSGSRGVPGTVDGWSWDVGFGEYAYRVDFDGRCNASWYLDRHIVREAR